MGEDMDTKAEGVSQKLEQLDRNLWKRHLEKHNLRVQEFHEQISEDFSILHKKRKSEFGRQLGNFFMWQQFLEMHRKYNEMQAQMDRKLAYKKTNLKNYHQDLVKLYKRSLENWREVLVHLNSLIAWEQPYYPGIISGVITLFFIILWYFDPPVLTAVSIIGMIICVLDYAMPILSSSVFDSSKWTGVKERKYEEICYELVTWFVFAKEIWKKIRQIKETKPYVYIVSVIASLVMTAWIGNLIDNLFLTYLITLIGSLLPGIKSHPMVQQHLSQMITMIKGIVGGQGKKNN